MRFLAAVGLFALSPFVAECLLGNVAVDQAGLVLLLAPMYGGGALVIREVARRTGGGWRTIAFLAAAFALLEEGLLTQLLFNPDYAGLDLLGDAYIPALGTGGLVTVTILALHGVWSISVPIALVEALAPRRGPWLGRVGFTIACLVFASGAVVVGYGNYTEERFLAAPGQLVGTAVVVVALVVAAFTVGRRRRPSLPGLPPSPLLVATLAFVSTGILLLPAKPPPWVAVALYLAVAAATIWLVARWSRREAWDDGHRLALAGGALLTYCWYGFVEVPIEATSPTIDLVGNAIFTAAALALLAFAVRTVHSRGGNR